MDANPGADLGADNLRANLLSTDYVPDHAVPGGHR